jgi:hypothetical protein
MNRRLALVVFVLTGPALLGGERPSTRRPADALREFNDLIGSWRGTGEPEGTREEKQRGFWTETQAWAWQFKKDDACLRLTLDKGKYWRDGELRYLPDKDRFQLRLQTMQKEKHTFEGKLQGRVLTLDRENGRTKETQRLVVTLLHANRFIYSYEVKPQGRSYFTRVYRVGATKEGVAFAGRGDTNPECVVSGGLGTRKVTYKGQTYYVCCTGCQEAFKDNPEKYIKEYAERKAKQARGQ